MSKPNHPSFSDFAADLRADYYAQEWRGSWAVALCFRRPGLVVAWLCNRLGLTPMAVTSFALLVALAIPAFAAWAPPGAAPLVVFLAGAIYQILDCTDGTLARVTNCTSQTGADLDFLIDMTQWAMLYIAIGILADRALGGGGTWAAVAGFAAWARLMARVIRDRLRPPGGGDARPPRLLDYPLMFIGGLSGLIPLLALAGQWLGAAVIALVIYSLLDIAEALVPLAERR